MREVARVRRRYEYDSTDRLARVGFDAGSSISYALDAAGNRVAEVVEPTAEGGSERETRG